MGGSLSGFMNILWVKSGGMLPADTGGRKRSLAMLREISRAGHRVTFLALTPAGSSVAQAELDDEYAAEKIWVEWTEPRRRSLIFFAGLLKNLFFSSRPYVLDKYRSTAWRKKIIETASKVDLVVCDFLTPAPNFVGLNVPVPIVLFQHNIESQIWKRLADTATNSLSRLYLRKQYQRMKAWEQRLSAEFTGVITVSPDDADFCRDSYRLTNVLGDVPTGVDVSVFNLPVTEAGSCIGFLGSMDWMPNVEGVLRFTTRILPIIRSRMPSVRLKIIGRNPTTAVRQLAQADPLVEVTGTVDEVQSHVHECSVMVVPLMAGGGTRIKIFECMAMGVPVVSTTIGAEGLPVSDGQEILIADEDEAFADAVLRLLDDREMARGLAARARTLVAERYSWHAAGARFIDLCQQTLN